MKYIKKTESYLQKTFVLLFLLKASLVIAQLTSPWEISVAPDMKYLTAIKPNEINDREVPFLSHVQRIWDESQSGQLYNAFTDLIRYKGKWYCTFREAEAHEWGDGGIRVLQSSDGNIWRSVAFLTWEKGDLRDPKFSVTPEGNLLLNSAIIFPRLDPPFFKGQSVTWLSSDGENWSDVYACATGLDSWRWSITWNNGIGFSFGYWGKDENGTLYTTCDGKNWNVLAKNTFPMGKGNESSIAFGENNIAYCLLRDGPGGMAHVGVAKPPYKEWTWTDLGMYAGGPEIIRLRDGRLLAVVRLHEAGLPPSDSMPGLSSNLGGGRTSLCWIDPEKGIMKEFLTLPSGGHGGHSYAGIVEYDGWVWISYYSSHENITREQRPSIYLAKVKLAEKKDIQ